MCFLDCPSLVSSEDVKEVLQVGVLSNWCDVVADSEGSSQVSNVVALVSFGLLLSSHTLSLRLLLHGRNIIVARPSRELLAVLFQQVFKVSIGVIRLKNGELSTHLLQQHFILRQSPCLVSYQIRKPPKILRNVGVPGD